MFKNTRTYVFAIAMVAFMVFGFGVIQEAKAQTCCWTFQQYVVTPGSPTQGYPIVTAAVPEGSYEGPVGSTVVSNPDGSVSRYVSITYYTPLSPDPLPTETHYLIAGCVLL